MGEALAAIRDRVLRKDLAGLLPFKEQSLCWMDMKKTILVESSPDQHFLKLKLLTWPANKIPVMS